MNMNKKYTLNSESVLKRAKEASLKFGNQYIGTEHILLGLCLVQHSMASKALENQNVVYHQLMDSLASMTTNAGKPQTIETALNINYTPRAKEILEQASLEAIALQSKKIGTEHILIALLKNNLSMAYKILKDLKVNMSQLNASMIKSIKGEYKNNKAEKPILKGLQHNQEIENITLPDNLRKFSKDFTHLAKENKFDPLTGRDAEIERMIQILSRRMKNNPCLIGDPGVGKTAIVEGLAQRIVQGNVPEELKGMKIVNLNLANLIAGSKYRGEFEERMKKLIKEVLSDSSIVLFIDEIHTVIGAGSAEGTVDASNILKPYLARGEIQVIGATTLEEYRKHIEKDAAFERRFQPIHVMEPSVEEAISMLQALKKRYEVYHNVVIAEETLHMAVKLSHRYLTERFLPDKAIDLIDEASAKLKLDVYTLPEDILQKQEQILFMEEEKEEAVRKSDFGKMASILQEQDALRLQLEKRMKDWEVNNEDYTKHQLTPEHILTVISRLTGIPLQTLQEEETQKLLNMEQILHERVIGQSEAIKSVSKAIRRGRVGLKDPNRPIGSFLFLGPTGVGKTELSKALSETLFGDESAMIRIDMSEYMEKHSVSRLVGAPPGYVGYEEGGQLSEKVRKKPYSVLLFDEIEKASPEVFNILLQVLDDGHITDGHGKQVNFKNTVIIMTSNAGARSIVSPKKLGFVTGETQETHYEDMKKAVMEEVKTIFKPEFLNRIDDTIVFHQLSKEEIKEIVQLMTKELIERVQESMQIELSFEDEAVDKLVEEGYDKAYGARPLRRAIQNQVENLLAEEFLKGTIVKGTQVSVFVEEEKGFFLKTITE